MVYMSSPIMSNQVKMIRNFTEEQIWNRPHLMVKKNQQTPSDQIHQFVLILANTSRTEAPKSSICTSQCQSPFSSLSPGPNIYVLYIGIRW